MVKQLHILVVLSTMVVSLTSRLNSEGERSQDNYRHELYIVLMAPYPAEDPQNNPSWVSGHIAGPAVQLAVDEINNRSDLLADYKLSVIQSNTACSGGYEVWKAIVDILRSDKQIVGIIGPGCSGAATTLAAQTLRPRYSLIAITPSATSPLLESPEYINTFATISSGTAYVKVYEQLMVHNKWESVSVLYDVKRSYFLQTFTKFSDVVGSNRTVFQSPVFDGDQEEFFPLQDIKNLDRGRVILSFASTDTARIMMCLAYHLEMTYPTYQWVFHDRTISQLVKVGENFTFHYNEEYYKCSQKDMAKAINGIILVHFEIKLDDEETITPTQKNFTDFSADYMNALAQGNVTDTTDAPLDYGNTNYDAAWAFALALNKTAARLNLTAYRYGQPDITEEIRNDLYDVNFQGASGPILFDSKTRSAHTDINVFQVQTENRTCPEYNDNCKVMVAFFNDTLNILPDAASSAFINDTFNNVPLLVHPALGVIVILVALALFSFTGILHVANTVWCSYRSIKATSPNISHLIFSGCYLFAVCIIIYTVQYTFKLNELVYSVMCNAFRWSLIMGYTLIFGTVLAKVWRVYRLFKHFRNDSPGCLLSDNALIVFVILLFFIDFLVCIIWDATDPFMHTDYVYSREQINKIPSLLTRSKCDCIHFNLWLGVIGTYKGTIALLLVVFSILNRKIRRRDFQHTKKINILIYSLTMMGGVLFPLYFVLDGRDIHISFVILSFMLSVAILMSCLVLFMVPVRQVIKIKMGLSEDAKFTEEIRRRVSIASVISFRSVTSEIIDNSDEL